MSWLSFGLIVLAAFMHATRNLAAKRAQGGQLFLTLCSLCSLVIYALPVAWLVAQQGLPRSLAAWGLMVISGGLHLIYFSALQRGYRVADLSVVYPVARGTAPLVSVLVAVIALGERPSGQAVIGAVVVVCGVFLLAGGAQLVKAPDPRTRRGVVWGAITGVLIASYTIVDGYSVRTLLVAPLLLDYVSHVVRVCVSLPRALSAAPAQPRTAALRQEWKRAGRYALVIATLGPLGYILVLIAMQTSPVSYVAPARELSMLVGAFFGARLLNEGDVFGRVASAGLIVVGVLLIALG